MFEQAKTGNFYDWHSPVVTAVWSLFGAKAWIIGATLILTIVGIAYYTYSIFTLAGLQPHQACLFTILTIYSPPVLAILVCVCKDSWVSLFFLGTIYYTICYHMKKRVLFAIIRNSMLVTAILIRPEFLVIAFLFFACEFFVSAGNRTSRIRKAVFNAILILVCYLAINGTVKRIEHSTETHPESFIYLSDLIDLSVYGNHLLIPDYFLNGSNLALIESEYQYPNVDPVFYGKCPNLTVHWPMPQNEFINLRRIWVSELFIHPARLIKHRLSVFESYLRDGSYFSTGIDSNNYEIFIHHTKSNSFLIAYLSSFSHGLLQRHIFSFFGSIALIFLLFKKAVRCVFSQWLITGLICAVAYQILFSVLGFPPYWRFASAGELLFWIALYIVIRDWFSFQVKCPSVRA